MVVDMHKTKINTTEIATLKTFIQCVDAAIVCIHIYIVKNNSSNRGEFSCPLAATTTIITNISSDIYN